MSADLTPATDDDVATLARDGIVARRSAFTPQWADDLAADVFAAFDDARTREGGAVGRGPNRWYVEMHPEQLRGFVDLASHPWVTSMCTAVLGEDYEIVELGFDIPFAGAVDQPWHRDFPSTPETYEQRRITSLAFNLTGVDTAEDMGPFEIAPGTQYLPGTHWDHGMFPPREEWGPFTEVAQRKYPQRGDVSARSALTMHRGTTNHSDTPRPVLVLGVDAPGAGHGELHDMQMTRAWADALPDEVRRHLAARVVDELEPIVQKHQIEGLVMGAAE